jgi:hypothetical protein
MFWVGVSLLVMAMTGLGDDTRSFLRFWQRLQKSAESEVADPKRKAEVVAAFTATRDGFKAQRESLRVVGDCIEKLDRTYEVSQAEYEACAALSHGAVMNSAEILVASRARFRAATTESERARIRARVLGE